MFCTTIESHVDWIRNQDEFKFCGNSLLKKTARLSTRMTIELVLRYDTTKFPFQETMKKVLYLEGDITQAHTLIQGATQWDQITFQNDTATEFHKRYYKSPHYKEMVELYHRFLQEWLLPQLEEDEYIVQKEPSFRIHIPNNTALGKRDDQNDDEIIGLHCDSDYNHPTAEVNYMLTITGQSESNSCYVESEPGKADFHSINLQYGEVFRFYGNKCRHYNKRNMTNQSRISFDFRIIPASQYIETESSAIHSGRKFTVGEYYMRLSKRV
jgi:hypothetical protein